MKKSPTRPFLFVFTLLVLLPAVSFAEPPPATVPPAQATGTPGPDHPAGAAWGGPHRRGAWQHQRHPEARAMRHARRAVIAECLHLTAQQKRELRQLHAKTSAAIRAVWTDSSLTIAQKRAKTAPLRRSVREQMKTLLTESQRRQMAQLMRHPRRLQMLARRHLRMVALARRLDLTPQQRTEIRTIAVKTRAAIRPIRENENLTAQEKRTRVHQLLASSRGEIRHVLNARQRMKLDRMRHRLLAPLGPLA